MRRSGRPREWIEGPGGTSGAHEGDSAAGEALDSASTEESDRATDAGGDADAPSDKLAGRFDSLDEAGDAFTEGEIDGETYADALADYNDRAIQDLNRDVNRTLGRGEGERVQTTAERLADNHDEGEAETEASGGADRSDAREDGRQDDKLAGRFDSLDEAGDALANGEIDLETYEEALSDFNDRMLEEINQDTDRALGEGAGLGVQDRAERVAGKLDEASVEAEPTAAGSEEADKPAPGDDGRSSDQLAGRFDSLDEAGDAFTEGEIDGETYADAVSDYNDRVLQDLSQDVNRTLGAGEASRVEAKARRIADNLDSAAVDEADQTEAPTTGDDHDASDAAGENIPSADAPARAPPGGDAAREESIPQADSRVERATADETGRSEGGRGWREVDDPEDYEDAIPEEQFKEAVVDALKRAGLSPGDEAAHGLEDCVYTKTRVSGASDQPSTSAYLRVGPDGEALPSPGTLDENRPADGYEEGSLTPARRLMRFKGIPGPDDSSLVLSSELDVESGIIEKQADTWTENTDAGYTDGVRDTLGEAGIGTGSPPGADESVESPGPASDDPTGGDGRDRTPEAGATDRERADSVDTAGEDRDPDRAAESAPVDDPSRSSDTYEVEPGDTLWDIADEQYGDPTEWTRLYEANSDVINDPDLIRPGQELTVPSADDRSPETRDDTPSR